MGTKITGEKGVPIDGEFSCVGRHGHVGLIWGGKLTVEERGAVRHDGCVDTKAGPGFLQMGGEVSFEVFSPCFMFGALQEVEVCFYLPSVAAPTVGSMAAVVSE